MNETEEQSESSQCSAGAQKLSFLCLFLSVLQVFWCWRVPRGSYSESHTGNPVTVNVLVCVCDWETERVMKRGKKKKKSGRERLHAAQVFRNHLSHGLSSALSVAYAPTLVIFSHKADSNPHYAHVRSQFPHHWQCHCCPIVHLRQWCLLEEAGRKQDVESQREQRGALKRR